MIPIQCFFNTLCKHLTSHHCLELRNFDHYQSSRWGNLPAKGTHHDWCRLEASLLCCRSWYVGFALQNAGVRDADLCEMQISVKCEILCIFPATQSTIHPKQTSSVPSNKPPVDIKGQISQNKTMVENSKRKKFHDKDKYYRCK